MGVYVVKVCNASVFGGCTSFMLMRLCFDWSDSFEIDFVVGGFCWWIVLRACVVVFAFSFLFVTFVIFWPDCLNLFV